MRSLEITKENLDNQRNAVQEERRLRRRQPAVRQDVRGDRRARLRQLRLQALGDRLDGRSRRRDGRRRRGVLQDLLRAEQRRARRSSATSRPADVLAKVEQVLRARFRRSRRPRRSDMTEPPQTAERRQTLEDPLARLPRLDIVWHTPPALGAGRRRADGAGDRAVGGPQLAALRQHRAAEAAAAPASARSPPTHAARACSSVGATALPGKTDRRSSRAAIYDGDREGEDRPDCRLGDREGAQQRASAARWRALGSSLQRAVLLGAVRAVLQRTRI